MKIKNFIHLLSIASIFLILLACQEEQITDTKSIGSDKDILAANELVNAYLSKSGARTDAKKSIIILRYEEGKLVYATSENNYASYEDLKEESITAIVEPGEYVFWYSGEGVSELDGVEFDKESQSVLGNYPEEINATLLWAVVMPDQFDATNNFLKYDVIYDYEGNTGPIIRLDPKLQLGN